MTDTVEEFIEHYGVKGMKWGVRRKGRGGLSKSEFKKSQDRQRAERLIKKGAKALSNQELKEVNNRLNLEQNFSRMNPDRLARGRHQANEILATAGVAVAAYNLAKTPAGKALVNSGKKFIRQAIKKNS